MARLARLVVPGAPHLVAQRVRAGEQAFFDDGDYRLYLSLLGQAARRAGAAIWSYCLTPGQVRVVLNPSDPDGVRRTFADLHRRYANHVNAAHGRTGELWRGRFGSAPLGEDYLLAAVRYICLSPVREGLVERAWDWPWSSARGHLSGRGDAVLDPEPVRSRVSGFVAFLGAREDPAIVQRLLEAETIGRPVGPPSWIAELEARSGRVLAPKKRGPKPRAPAAA